MADIEVFLDETPGETRGVIARDGLFTHLILHRDSDRPSDRLGARCVGRIARVEPGLRGAFVDLGAGEPFGFLPLRSSDRMAGSVNGNTGGSTGAVGFNCTSAR